MELSFFIQGNKIFVLRLEEYMKNLDELTDEIEEEEVLGDIIESIGGAIFVDSGFDKDTTFKCIRPLLEPLVTPQTVKLHPLFETLPILTIESLAPPVQDPIIDEADDVELIDWLGTKDESSTVFVSFGSEYFLSKEDMEEIAFGLENSNVNFIWIARFPKGEEQNLEDVLPKGFLERIGDMFAYEYV
ncbi:Beta-D-glucosyl crocetin beta-1,6-glucosyltransferase [Capsicum chinense]|nr:Beta-D-glucosyl crocetin beta-1,6-glucosyltransferase [Capsicum chinense]